MIRRKSLVRRLASRVASRVSNAAMIDTLEARVFLSAVNVAINTATRYQQITGFGTATFLPNNGYYETAAYQKMYYQDLGSSMLRLPFELDALEGPGGTIASPVTLVDNLQTDISMFNFQQDDVQSDGQLAAASKTYGLDSFKLIGTIFTPPHWMKGPEVDAWTNQPDGNEPFISYAGTNSAGGSLIDTPDNLQQFGRYVAAYVEGFQQTFGMQFYAIGIQNELAFSEIYNSCVYSPEILVDAIKAVKAAFVEYGITTKIMGPEDVGVGTTAYTGLLDRQMNYIDAVNADPAAKADLDIYAIHGYADDPTNPGHSPAMWANYWNDISADGKQSWQTELNGYDHTIDGAILLAENIQDSLVQGNVNAWLFWQTSTGQSDDATSTATLTSGTDETDPKFGSMEQFSRYIRPGSYRVAASPSDPNGVYVSAFVQDAQQTLTTVVINDSATTQTVNLNVSGVSLTSFNVDRMTDATETFADQGPVAVTNGVATITLPAQSIVTLQGNTLVVQGPPAPTGLTATAADAQVALMWNAAAGAATYNIERGSTTGGPYSIIKTGVTGTTFTDTGLTDGAAYYYVVTAVNSGAVVSPISNEASATPVAATGVSDTIFGPNAGPTGNQQNVSDPTITADGGVELGMKFRSDVAGTVTGVRFWMGSQNTGPHTGELWSSTGQLLATATFANSSSPGWQQVNFSSPVAITANTTYIVSYHTTAASIAYSPGAFAGPVDSIPLHALANGTDGPNGVYSYDQTPGTSAFPSSSNGQLPNYWVDVVFTPAAAASSIFSASSAPTTNQQNVNDPTITSAGGVELGLKFRSDVAGSITGVRFFKGAQETGAQTGELWSSAGQLLATVNFTNETANGWQQANFSSPVSIAANTVYIISYHTTSQTIAYTAGAFASSGVDNPPLHALVGGAGGDGVYSYDTTPGTSAFPTSTNGQSPNYWVDVVFSPSSTPTVNNVFGNTAPATNNQNLNDPGITSAGGVDLGLKFRSDVAGMITGVRFFKGNLDTGTQIGQLWSSTGQLLASATFTNESTSGWQQVNFSSPVAISANTTYIIAYHTTSAFIAYTPQALAGTGFNNGPLHILGNGVDGPNGVYSYDATPGAPQFPSVFNNQSPNYWVDVVFQAS